MSSIIISTRISHKLLKEINEMRKNVCLENSYHCIESVNVGENDLFIEGLHLQYFWQKKLSYNFVVSFYW